MVEGTCNVVKCRDGKFDLISESIPKPGDGELLIQVEYSTVNPYDHHIYNAMKSEGQVLGCDGCGTVVEIGTGIKDDMIGKKVAFMSGGWAQYRICKPFNIIELDDTQDLSKAGAAYINPLTCTGMFDLALKNRAKAVIVTAAASQLGQQFIKLAKLNGISTIGIVRKDAHVRLLQEIGAVLALNQSDDAFYSELDKAIEELKPTVFFDFVGDQMCAEITHKLPPDSHAVIVGNFSHKPMLIDSPNIRRQAKHIYGFSLFSFLQSLNKEKRQNYNKLISDDLRDGGKIFGTNFVTELSLNDWENAINQSTTISTDGKILIKCQN